MAELHCLSYIVATAKNLSEWETFGTDIIGMVINDKTNNSISFKMDAEPWRVKIETGDSEDMTHAGWKLNSEAELVDYVNSLEEKGIEVTKESYETAEARNVKTLYSIADPNGYRHEFYAERTNVDTSLKQHGSVIRGNGFKTEDLGLGHILPVAKNYQESLDFYKNILGLRYSDRIIQEIAPGITADATFFHTQTGRHHSLATGQFPSSKVLNHLMLEFQDMNDVGAAYDRATKAGVPIVLELGHHPNDKMFSFYMRTPSGFGVELGHGGIVIDEKNWEPQVYPVMSDWGHKRNMNMIEK